VSDYNTKVIKEAAQSPAWERSSSKNREVTVHKGRAVGMSLGALESDPPPAPVPRTYTAIGLWRRIKARVEAREESEKEGTETS